ncbi:MAG: ATP-dependent zinc metalloprotease FtsH [Lachnospiraceae bacterium]|nr:ATP-dependent zinc metalloprotease FtsH [Lachnospiraceae bacterium]
MTKDIVIFLILDLWKVNRSKRRYKLNTKKSKNNGFSGFGTYALLVLLVVLIWYGMTGNTKGNSYTRAEFEVALQTGKVSAVKVIQNREVPTGSVQIFFNDKTSKLLYTSDVNDIQTLMNTYGFGNYTCEDVPEESWIMILLPYLLIFGAFFILFVIMNNNAAAQSGGSKMMNFGKSRAKLSTDEHKNVSFKNVAGLSEEKEELEEIVDFLRSPKKYTQLGARIPKGVLLVGPPGTGKTLLAKAVAGEAGVPFFSISGSDFVEMFVGVGASRVRDLFEDAKKNAPCIVFIDEIDAVARRRGTGMGGGHDEREQTLNQMLVEMDGFGVNEGIIVMAATNRVDILDPAIMRPGRFDRKIVVGRPDVGGREEILNVHAKNKPLGDDVDLKQIAQTTAGFTGADLENLLNEAAITTARENRAFITQADIRKSFVRVGIGAEKKSRIISDKEKRITAYHEAGHAILFHLLPDVGPVYTVSIIPTGAGAAGYTMPLPEKDEMFNSKGRMIQEIIVGLGGRVAEELIFDDVTTGASQDIKQATRLAKDMVTKYGMSENIGLICYSDDDNEVFIGRDLAHTRSYSEGVAAAIDAEVKQIIDDAYAKAKQMIIEKQDILERCAQLLLEKEKISREEFEALFEE